MRNTKKGEGRKEKEERRKEKGAVKNSKVQAQCHFERSEKSQ